MNAERVKLRTSSIWISLILATLVVEICYRLEVRVFDAQGAATAFITWYFGCLILGSPLIVIGVSRAAKRHSDAVLETALHADLASVGALVDSLSDGGDRCERQYREALMRLLPQLDADNAHLLDEYRQAKLRYIVWPPASPIYSTYLTRLSRNSAQSVALRLVIIEALSRVGDSEALTMFDEMMDCRAYTSNERRIQQAVRESRPALLARVEQQPARRSLLRPANHSDQGSLPRIIASEFEMPPQDLLHVND